MQNWTRQDSLAAQEQGWDAFEVWDSDMESLGYEIQRHDFKTTFVSDEAAREYVRERASRTSSRDALCHKAWVIVFQSKLTKQPKKRSKK